MMDLMYEIPSDDTVGICTITKDVVENHGEPEIVYRDAVPIAASAKRRVKNENPGEIA